MTKPGKEIRPLQKKAKKGDINAMFELHNKYASGQGVDLDENKANDYFTQCLSYLNAIEQQNGIEKPKNKVTLNRLKLIDFRKFSSLDVEFDPRLTVIIGDNGAGKTTIIDAIAKTFSWINARIEVAGKTSKSLKETDININSLHYAEASTYISLGSTHYDCALSRSVKGAENEKKSHLESFRDFSNLYRVVNDKQRQQQQPEINIPLFASYSVDRHAKSNQTFDIEKLKDIETSSRFDALDSSALDGTAHFETFLEWYITLDNLINATPQTNNEALKRDVDALEAVVTNREHPLWQMLEEKKAHYQTAIDKQSTYHQKRRIKLQQTIKDAIIKTVPSVKKIFVDRSRSGRAEFKIINEGSEINVFQASQGQQILISLVADIARRLALLNPQLDTPTHGQGIVLIDEIELHLHPQWQQSIIQSLQTTFANIQFIVTTHSPQVLSTVDKRCIREFGTDKNGLDIVKVPKFQTKGVTSAQILARVMHTDATPKIKEAQWLNQFSALLQAGQKEAAEAQLAKLLKHFTSDDENTEHPVIEDCRNQIKIVEMQQRMRQRKAAQGAK